MYTRCLRYFTIAALLILSSKAYSQGSVTSKIPTYLEMCKKAAENSYYFHNFRSIPEYAPILECGFAGESAKHLLENGSPNTLSKLEAFRKLDQFGNPTINDLPKIGRFSGTTLRYIVIADQIMKLFKLPANAKIVEIGAGFGGQCYILSQLQPFSKYFIYDLPEVESLIEKMMSTLSIENVLCLPTDMELPEEKVDLLISNYAFSECDRETQMEYFEKALKKADRGYMICNQLNNSDALSISELLELLQNNLMNPKLYQEPIFTYQGNVLIVWDKTSK